MRTEQHSAQRGHEAQSNLAPRVEVLESEVRSLAITLKDSIKHQDAQSQLIFSKIDDLSEKLDVKTTPSLANMALWAGVVLTLIFGVSTPIITSMSNTVTRDRTDARRDCDQLDTKIQKEVALETTLIAKSVGDLERFYLTRHDDLIGLVLKEDSHLKEQIESHEKLIDRLFARNYDRDQRDLEELRARRMKDTK